RRAAFLRHVLRTIPVGNAAVMEARIEDVGGQTFDAATTRAVGGFSSWIGEAAFLKEGGRLLAWTTDTTAVEREVGPRFHLDREITIPGSTFRRIAVLIKAG
ncbi:MAG: RsmG family class I SAM-dependent methyltransferase, partial [Syntrophomonadaceae bacterium]